MPLTRRLSSKSLIKQSTSQDLANGAYQTITKDTFTAAGVGPYSLSVFPASINNTQVYVAGVYQLKTSYTLVNNQITFGVAPPAGTTIEVISGSSYIIGTPSDGTVTTAKISSGAAALGTVLTANGTGGVSFTNVLPTATRYVSGAGSWARPAGVKWIRVRMVGGGGGGAGANVGSLSLPSGFSGVNTEIAAPTIPTISAGAGSGASGGAGGTAGIGGQPSVPTQGVGFYLLGAVDGGGGGTSTYTPGGTSQASSGGSGGNSFYGGGGAGANWSTAVPTNGQQGAANTGGGGGGGGATLGSNLYGGAGGGAGAYIEFILVNPPPSISYLVGTGGAGGAGVGAGASNGGAGGSGVIIIEEYYQ